MKKRMHDLAATLNRAVDWFVPTQLKHSRDILQGVRMFLFSHLFGPFLGLSICLSMLYAARRTDVYWWILTTAIAAFWLFPFILRLTGCYVPLALISIQNLIFCIFWGAYNHGGISSPVMLWMVTVPLLAFFYLPGRSTRIIVAALIIINLVLFNIVYDTIGFRAGMAQDGLVLLGLVSIFAASVYVSMMALYFANIVSSQAELEQEVRRHLITEAELRAAAAQAQRSLSAKSEFLARMSHELKNPLNSIIGYSEMLIENLNGSIRKQKYDDLTSIKSAGYRLLELINDLLDLSRLEAGKVSPCNQTFEFSEFLEKLALQRRPSILENGNTFVVRLPPVGQVVADPYKLQRVVEGLLSNAAKFTKNGSVTLSGSLQDDSLTILVKDTGIGIAATLLPTLFETFSRSEGETASTYVDEVRLGLPLAYRICRLMGGALSVQSEVGVGSTVTVTLPRHPPPGVGAHAGVTLEAQLTAA